jgi:penicillin amidase
MSDSKPVKRTRLRRLRRVLLWLAGALVVVVLVLVVTGALMIWRSWPQVSGAISAQQLQASAEVIRDKWGVTHIFAQNSHDLFFAQGFVQAQDRMWQLEFSRRLGSGRLSEFLGPDTLGLDRFVRVVGLRRAAQRDWERMNSDDRAALEAFAAGINTYVNQNRSKLAVEFRILGVDPEPWTPVDSLVIVKLMSWVLSENASIQISRARIIAKSQDAVAKQLLPPYSEHGPIIIPHDTNNYRQLLESVKSVAKTLGTGGPTKGSNSWVVAGNRTTTGRPLLGNDTHLDLFLPSVWYAGSLHGGGYDTVGYALAGTPGISIGHNQRIAWGLTDLVADVQDFYFEKLDDDAEPKKYEYRGEWLPLQYVEEQINIKDAPPVTLRIAHTRHGPLVNNWIRRFKDSRPLALSWSAGESDSLIQAILLLNRANNWNEFRHALSLWNGPNLSFVYADVDGNIGFQAAGRIPVRAPLDQGIVPVVGWTGEYDWNGYVPFEGLPQFFNPSDGLIVTANQKPVADDYPYQLGYEFADPYRAIRLNQLLSAGKQITLDDAKAIMGDTYHLPAEALRPHLVNIKPANDLEARAIDELRAWNLKCDPDQVGASIYQVWYRFLVEDTVKDELGPELTEEYLEFYWIHGPVMLRLVDEGTSSLFDDTSTPQVETRDDILRRSLSNAVAWLSRHYGPNPKDWTWGRLHTMSFRHRPIGMADIPVLSRLFSYGPIAAPGCDRFTVNAAWFTWDEPEHPYNAIAGTSQRIIMDANDWDRSVAINSSGQSESLFHAHRTDQIPMWQKLQYHPLLYTRKAIETEAESFLKLEPVANSQEK